MEIYQEAIAAYRNKTEFVLPDHTANSSTTEKCPNPRGIIDVLGTTEAELICLVCSTHFLARLDTIEDPDRIEPWPYKKTSPN